MNEFLVTDELFSKNYGSKPKRHFLSYGRIEILGNHTDHQGGKCLVAACDLSIKASVSPSDRIEIVSNGYSSYSFDLSDLEMREEEKGTSLGITRGVLKYLKDRGYGIGGFKAALDSDIYAGAGVSSSAAFEILIGEIANALYNEEKIDRLTLAKAGQYSENVYYGKPSGLLDQCGSSFGGVSYVDFHDEAKVEKILFPSSWDISIYLVNPGASHQGFDGLYASIPNGMRNAAKIIAGKNRLSDVSKNEFLQKAYQNPDISPLERDRAIHYYEEVERVERAFSAIEEKNLEWFLECVRETELSQETLLRNVMCEGHYDGSPLEAVNIAKTVLKKGAARGMGGGFFGSIICFVPKDEEKAFLDKMSSRYGEKAIKKVSIPDEGAHEVRE